ncbi:efflux RND transporter periplasmic adaptor subunit [Caenimonas sedimenti]|uniref:Efflux RND transporter periplasmic adaptor subunit n=1 Tax=Caenimonas sedimenti TaxID=2596921 RepID=A0A562ZEC7_9BURK|nr:efflux RND transporter periplasmic adaptor subunit [Caenimonas sedimenti]TWO64430.1 efflux RND transporter periplasmic adaptor subunit [Caenimonas sedimenti]
MTSNHKLAAIAVAAAIALAGYGVFRMGQYSAMGPAAGIDPAAPVAVGTGPAAKAPLPQSIPEGEEATRRHIKAGIKAGEVDPANGHKILYYHDPMVPGNKFDKPAKSPFMDMMLVPVYAGADTDQGGITVSPRIQQNLGVRTAVASEDMLSPQVSAVGSIAFNEREQAVIQARATGYVERLLVRATLDRVNKGQALAELYVPDWVAAQQEYLAVRRLQGPDLGPLVEGAKSRMRLAGMTEEQVRGVEASGRLNPRTTVVAPGSGLVTEIAAREGMAVMPGATLFRISGFATVWANAEVPESQAALLRPGARVKAQTPATPGVVYEGRVETLLPDVSTATRTIKARVELANPRGQLIPGMFVSMSFSDMRPEKSIVVPTEAVIHTGKRAVVIVAEENGRFRPVEVQAGIESGGQTEIRKGLQAGQRVVVSSQFLIDSEASLKGVEARLNNEPAAPAVPAAPAMPRHQGEGTIREIGKDSMAIAHGPLPSAGMGAMTMEFKLPAPNQLPRNLAAGDRIAFEFFLGPDGPQLTHVSPMSAAAAAASGSRK